MAKFEDSLKEIEGAFAWAERQDVSGLRRFLIENANIPLYVFSSGGSGGVGKYVAMLYESNMGMAKALTPLMMASIGDEALSRSKILMTCTKGKGVDEKYVVQRAVQVNPKGVCAVTRDINEDNYVIQKLKGVTDKWYAYDWPLQHNSFIATTSTPARFGLFYKAFTNDSEIVSRLKIDLNPSGCYTYRPRIEGSIPSLDKVKNYVVLYAGWSEPIAYDFESKMVESGIASVQLCDYRNFCHGRFIFVSNHMEETALVLLLTPREEKFVRKLIMEGKDRGGNDLFPKDLPIAIISTSFDSPLATLDLLVKERVFFNYVAKAYGIEPCSPPNPKSIDKRIPRGIQFTPSLMRMGTLKSRLDGSVGTMKGVNRKKVVKYDPYKSIAKIAKDSGVSEATVRAYIKEKGIDRERDNRVLTYNKVWTQYIKDTNQSVAEIAEKVKMSEATIKKFLAMNPNSEELKVAEGKVGMVGIVTK